MTQGVVAILFDLGDVLMIEESEEKDSFGITARAELRENAIHVLQTLAVRGYLLGLVADTRIGTYKNVLQQHGVYHLFSAFAISEEVGCCKPNEKMFAKALHDLAVSPKEYHRVLMVGNNLEKDIAGANRMGLTSIWTHWNDRYPVMPNNRDESPDFTIGPLTDLLSLVCCIESSFMNGNGISGVKAKWKTCHSDTL